MSLTSIQTIAASFVLTAASACHAQLGGVAPLPEVRKVEGPTLEETVRWITEKISTVPPGACDYSNTDGCTWQFRFEGCNVTLIKATRYPTTGNTRYEAEEFALSEVTVQNQAPLSLPGKTVLFFSGIGDKEVVILPYGRLGVESTLERQLVWLKTRDRVFRSALSFSMIFDNSEIVDRLATAFRHAQGICRQRAAEENAKRLQDEATKNAKKPGELF